MPTVLYSSTWGAGFKVPASVKARYLELRNGTSRPVDPLHLNKAFHLAVYDVQPRTIGGWIVGGSENARAIPQIVEMYLENPAAWDSTTKHFTFSEVFADWWYVSEHDGRETLHINVDGPFYRLSESFMSGLIDDATFYRRFREAEAARKDLVNAVEMGEIAYPNIDIFSNRLAAAFSQTKYSKEDIAREEDEEQMLEAEDFEDLLAAELAAVARVAEGEDSDGTDSH